MKRLVCLLTVMLLVGAVNATVIAFDDFDGGATGLADATTPPWDGFSIGTGSIAPGFGQQITVNTSGNTHDRMLSSSIDLTGDGVYYVAGLFRATGTGEYSGIKFDNGSGTGPQILWRNSGGYRLYKDGWLTGDIDSYAADTTYFAVMKVVASAAGQDTMSLMMYDLTNGDVVPVSEPGTWDASVDVTFSRTVDRIRLEGKTAVNTSFDNILVANDWADVQAASVPEPATMVLLGLGTLILRRKK